MAVWITRPFTFPANIELQFDFFAGKRVVRVGDKLRRQYMTEVERYLFDLNGYLVLPSVLSSDEVDEINAVIDKVLPDWHIKAKSGHILTGFDEETAGEE